MGYTRAKFTNTGFNSEIKKRVLLLGIWNTLNSMKFGITLLIVVAVLSIIGVIIGEVFHSRYDPFRSLWYQVPLSILALSLFVCLVSRLRSILKLAFGRPTFKTEAEEIKRLRFSRSLTLQGDGFERRLRHHLKGYRLNTLAIPNGVAITAVKGGVSRLGSLLNHLGLLLLFLGGLIISLFGYSVMHYGSPGEIIRPPGADFQVRIDDFRIEYNEKGRIKDYISELTVLRGGDEILRKRIEVNSPLRYQGFNFYQASYNLKPDTLRSATVEIRDPENQWVTTIKAPFQQEISLPNMNLTFKVDRFLADFKLGEGGRARLGSNEPRNPAVLIEVLKDGEELYHQWAFLKFPEMHWVEREAYSFILKDFEPLLITGLEVTTVPGGFLIWTGISIMSLGLVLAFYFNHRRIWAVVRERGDHQYELTVGGVAHKNAVDFENEFKTIVRNLKA
ncbi:cytochrome c biogenesis protein ResB [candidate division KSB1 bacterium]|nr:cytochrome c biogenesis protein ResB [candidate division KSB1 bacterium]